jgi:O-antigen/teichoic acid export membrane protein
MADISSLRLPWHGTVWSTASTCLRGIAATARSIAVGGCERERAQRDAIAAYGIRIASAGLLYISQVALARWMGSDAYGIYVIAWTVVLVLGGLSSLGLNQAVMRLVPQYRAAGDTGLLSGLIDGSRWLALVAGSAIAALGLAGLALWGHHIDGPLAVAAYLALVCVPMYAVTDVQDGIGRGHGWMGLGLLPPYVLRPALVLTGMTAAHLLSLPMTATTAMAAAILATWATGLIQLWALSQRLPRPTTATPSEHDLRGWLGVGLPLMAVTGAEITLQCADVLILSRTMAPTDIAVYYAAAKTMSLLLYVHYAVGSAAAKRLAALDTTGDKSGLERTVPEIVRWTFWPSLAAGLVILALGQPLLSLFGPQFTAGYPVMMVLVAGFLARAAVGPSDTILRMLGQHRLSAAISVATAVLNVALLLALIPAFGLVGAAAATAVALTAEAACNWLAARRRLGLHIGIWQAPHRG